MGNNLKKKKRLLRKKSNDSGLEGICPNCGTIREWINDGLPCPVCNYTEITDIEGDLSNSNEDDYLGDNKESELEWHGIEQPEERHDIK
jgi:hypothetical protein